MGEGPARSVSRRGELRYLHRRRCGGRPGRRRRRRRHRGERERVAEHGERFRRRLPRPGEPLDLRRQRTATPIKHLVVIFDENESFDHYFGTYPYAANTDGTPFHAKPGTPTVNGLYTQDHQERARPARC